ncbi:MAG: MFS transporter, partial [Hyphomicrobium sp.]
MTQHKDSAPKAAVPMTQARERWLLWVLLFGNFVVGTGILLPAGMLSTLAAGLDVSLPVAGNLMLASGFVVAVGAPLIAAFTSRVDRRTMLVAALAIFVVTHVAAAFAPDYETLMLARVLMAVAAAIFTPQAAATVGALLPPERRARAITMIFVGWSLATVGGMPLGGYVAHAFGWRAALAIVAGLSAVCAVALSVTVPKGVRIPRLSAASWVSVATNPALLLVLLVTVLNGTGQFTVFTYLNPSLKMSLAAGAGLLTFVLAWYGIAATLGNILASRVISRFGPARSALVALLGMAVGLAIWGAGAGILWVVLIAATLWGLGTFATNSIQQARLAGLAPDLTSAAIALNTSAIYLGQAFGSGLGGLLIDQGALVHL